jgi:hypothetical protein
MGAEAGYPPDWRDPGDYSALLGADRSAFAWEWLRRDPAYRSAAHEFDMRRSAIPPSPGPARFGLAEFEPARRGVPDARPVWRADIHPLVLVARAVSATARGDLFDLAPFAALARLVRTEHADHLLLSDGLHSIRLDASPGAFASGGIYLAYELGGLVSAEAPLLTLRRFLALSRTGRFSRVLHPREPRARRWILMLRAWDALAAGADQRQIAEVLLSRSAREPRWRSRAPSVRSQAQRLVRSARALAGGGYRQLLC